MSTVITGRASITLGTSHTNVSTVGRASVGVVPYSNTFALTLGTSHTNVSTVGRASVRVVTYRNTFSLTLGTSYTNVSTVGRASVRVVTYRHIFTLTLGTSHYKCEYILWEELQSEWSPLGSHLEKGTIYLLILHG